MIIPNADRTRPLPLIERIHPDSVLPDSVLPGPTPLGTAAAPIAAGG
ncbi:hypothetical protein [Streptomyces sp. NPDC059604]